MSQMPAPRARDERNNWPAFWRPDAAPPTGWSHACIAAIERPRSHTLSPDGKKLAFFWDRGDCSNLYVQSIQGGWALPLTFDREPLPYWFDDPPQWSPDGEWIAYTSRGHVWVTPIKGGMPRRISDFTSGAAHPRWLPDSRGLLIQFEKGELAQILLTDRYGGWPRPVTTLEGWDSDFHCSPDGRHVAFVRQAPGDWLQSGIWAADLSSGETYCLGSAAGVFNRSPRWSPDGKSIAFISDRTGFYELFVLEVQTGSERQVTQLGSDVGDLCWSAGGDQIVCTVNRQGAFDIVRVDVYSGEATDLLSGYGFHARPQFSPDGRTITYEYDSPVNLPDIYSLDVETGAVTQLTFSTPPAISVLDHVLPERLSYPSDDGLEIPAFLYRPKNPNGAAIVYPHGGPTAQFALEWDAWVQYMAAKGYTILAPNYRGSTGYGRSFERANDGLWGVGDRQDCLCAYDYLASLAGINPNRIAIVGGSYGGYLVYCCLAQDPRHRFACGVAKYGDCNILTSWAQGESTGREDLHRILGRPESNRLAYRAASPVWQVENIQAPLLIVHGLHDPYVHPLQSEELVEALKRAGKTFEYKTYPDEGHGVLLRKNLLDYYARMERFLDWYLL